MCRSDGLSAARGIILGCALGLAIWIVSGIAYYLMASP